MNPKARTMLLACAVVAALTASMAPALAVEHGPARSHATGQATRLAWRLVASPNGPSTIQTCCLVPPACPRAPAWLWDKAAPGASPNPGMGRPGPSGQPAPADSGGPPRRSCVTPRACTAVGFHGLLPGRTLVETWNGTKWTVVPSPNAGPASAANILESVSCVSARACTAVGGSSPARPQQDPHRVLERHHLDRRAQPEPPDCPPI